MQKEFEKWLNIIGAVIVIVAAAGGLFVVVMLAFMVAPQTVRADELAVYEKYMLTDTGRIVLQTQECPNANERGFVWRAYATENDAAKSGQQKIHEGCWYKDHQVIMIWFYAEEPPLIANFHEGYFKDGMPEQKRVGVD